MAMASLALRDFFRGMEGESESKRRPGGNT